MNMGTIILILALLSLIIIYLLIEKKQRNKTIKETFKRMDEITDKYRKEKIVLIKKMVKENLEDIEKTKIKDRISWIDGYLDAYTILKEQFNLL